MNQQWTSASPRLLSREAAVVPLGSVRLPRRPGSERYFVGKRLLDIVLSVLLLAALVPVFLLVAVAIRIDSPGPVMFRQQRAGAQRLRGEDLDEELWHIVPFTLFKFRTMSANADQNVHAQHIALFTQRRLDAGTGMAQFKLAGDARITKVGRFLRRSSIDELPQLLNVLRGEMSLVGPRPVPLYELKGYSDIAHYGRFAGKPGITGLWQISGRGNLSFDQMIALDRQLIERRSLSFDVLILVRTLSAVLRGAGAS